jgi:hypothetical protein
VRAVRSWNEFWFRPAPIRRVAAFRIVIAGFALLSVIPQLGASTRHASADSIFYRPLSLFQALHLPRATPGEARVVFALLVLALACAVIGLRGRLALAVAAPLYTWWMGTDLSFWAISHTQIPVVIALFALAVSPSSQAYSVDAALVRARHRREDPRAADPGDDPLAGWALRVVRIALVLAYVLSAYSKLRTSGIAWVDAGAVESALADAGGSLARATLHHAAVLKVLAATTLFLESTAWMALFGGWFRNIWLAGLACFHIGVLVLVSINFLPYLAAYSAFFDLEVGMERITEGTRSVRSRLGLGADRRAELVS